MNRKKRSIVYVLLCVGLWSLIPVVSKLGQTSLDNHQFLFWSSLVSFLTFIVIVMIGKRGKEFLRLPLKGWIKSIVLGFLGTYLYYILLYFGYANAQGIEVLIIQYCWPIFVVLLSVFILRESLNFRKMISIVLGFAGVFIVLSKGKVTDIHLDNLYVDGIVLLAAFVFALFSVLSKKVKIDALVLTTIYFLTATIIALLSMVQLSDFVFPDGDTIIPILINGIFVNGISYIFWIRAIRLGKASFVAPFVFLTPVVSTLLLMLFFGEAFEIIYLIGMVAVIIGGLINR